MTPQPLLGSDLDVADAEIVGTMTPTPFPVLPMVGPSGAMGDHNSAAIMQT